jgi:indole-3-glycerol phosphate synthase
MVMDLLERIRAAKRAETENEKRVLPMRRAIELASAAPPPHPFAAALRRPDRATAIAEVPAPGSKRAAGALLDPAATARSFAAAGAAALSVITDTLFLQGSPAHLREVRAAVDLPLLRKDFIVGEYGLYRSRALGADAILVIARLFEPRLLQTLIGVSRSLHMDALVEVRDEEDVLRALDCGADLVVVNNRDATTRAATVETSLRLAPLLTTVVRVSAGGIETAGDVVRLRAAGFDAVLVGERLMREADPGEALRRILGGAGS